MPERAPGGTRECAEAIKIDAKSLPRAKKSRFSRAGVRKASPKQFFVDFRQFSVFLQSLRTLESAAPASKNRGSALRAASRVARAMQPRKTMKIGSKIDPKSSEIASRSVSRTLFGRLWSLGGARSSDSGRLGRLVERLAATKSLEVGRSSPLVVCSGSGSP